MEASNTDGQSTEHAPTRSGRLLVIDDDRVLCESIRRYFIRMGHSVDVAHDLATGRRVLEEQDFEVVLVDLRLGRASGIDMMRFVREHRPRTRLIMISAEADVPAASAAIEVGLDHLVTKPFRLPELEVKVQQSLARRAAEEEAERENRLTREKLSEREQESQSLVLRAMHSLAAAVEAKDEYTAGHASRVTSYALVLASSVPGIDLDRFRLACELHDVGKIGVPDAVLNKPGRLTEEEVELVRAHPDRGVSILSPLLDDPMILGVLRYHHERWDGAGYPLGLAGEDVPVEARIAAVADTLDAMTSHRAYRKGLPWAVAADEVRRCAGTQFDPAVVLTFEQCEVELRALHRSFFDLPRSDDLAGPQC